LQNPNSVWTLHPHLWDVKSRNFWRQKKKKKNIPMEHKYADWPYNIPNGDKQNKRA
jgi:hypothetical protein